MTLSLQAIVFDFDGVIADSEPLHLRAFQKTLQEQSARMYGGDSARGAQDLWAQFMNLQGPAMQSLMQAYMEQSQKMFAQFQENMQSQARNMFTGMNFPGFSPKSDPEKK